MEGFQEKLDICSDLHKRFYEGQINGDVNNDNRVNICKPMIHMGP